MYSRIMTRYGKRSLPITKTTRLRWCGFSDYSEVCWKLVVQVPDPGIDRQLLFGEGCSRDREILQRTEEFSRTNSTIFRCDSRIVKQDKDVSKYDMVLAQSLDGIRARAKWNERSTAELKQWLENWKKQNGGA